MKPRPSQSQLGSLISKTVSPGLWTSLALSCVWTLPLFAQALETLSNSTHKSADYLARQEEHQSLLSTCIRTLFPPGWLRPLSVQPYGYSCTWTVFLITDIELWALSSHTFLAEILAKLTSLGPSAFPLYEIITITVTTPQVCSADKSCLNRAECSASLAGQIRDSVLACRPPAWGGLGT